MIGLGLSLTKVKVPTSAGLANTYSVLLDGTNEGIAMGSPAAVDNIWTGGGTMSCWLYPTGLGTSGNARVFDKSKFILSLSGLSGGKLKIEFFTIHDDGGSDYGYWHIATTVVIDQWNHLVVTFNDDPANDPIFYNNNTAYTVGDGITKALTPSGSYIGDEGENGFWGNNSGFNRGFLGNMDELSIYSKVLSAEEVTTLYNSGTPSDSSAISNLTGYWRFEEGSGTSVADSSTSDNAGTLTNMESGDWVAY